jgi:DNA sulfur modification protein DndE
MAIMISLEEGPLGGASAPDEEGSEFNAYTLSGEYGALIAGLLRWVEEGPSPETPLDNEGLVALLRGHIHRGVGNLSVRAKSPLDILRLVPAAA